MIIIIFNLFNLFYSFYSFYSFAHFIHFLYIWARSYKILFWRPTDGQTSRVLDASSRSIKIVVVAMGSVCFNFVLKWWWLWGRFLFWCGGGYGDKWWWLWGQVVVAMGRQTNRALDASCRSIKTFFLTVKVPHINIMEKQITSWGWVGPSSILVKLQLLKKFEIMSKFFQFI